MIVVPGVSALDAAAGRLFIVVGVFDGLHRGHHYLLRRLLRAARARGARPAVITFDHHPDEILVGAAPPLLCDPAERLARLEAAGVEVTVVQHFDEVLRRTPYDAFIEAIRARVDLAGFLMTPDAAFGHERGGTPSTVGALGARDGFDVVVVPPFTVGGRPVRSTDIRAAIAAGDLAGARALLGRRVAVVGIARRAGERDPAVDVPLPVALPPDGAYDVRVAVAGHRSAPAWATIEGGAITLAGSFTGPVRVTFAG